MQHIQNRNPSYQGLQGGYANQQQIFQHGHGFHLALHTNQPKMVQGGFLPKSTIQAYFSISHPPALSSNMSEGRNISISSSSAFSPPATNSSPKAMTAQKALEPHSSTPNRQPAPPSSPKSYTTLKSLPGVSSDPAFTDSRRISAVMCASLSLDENKNNDYATIDVDSSLNTETSTNNYNEKSQHDKQRISSVKSLPCKLLFFCFQTIVQIIFIDLACTCSIIFIANLR